MKIQLTIVIAAVFEGDVTIPGSKGYNTMTNVFKTEVNYKGIDYSADLLTQTKRHIYKLARLNVQTVSQGSRLCFLGENSSVQFF